MLFLRSISQSCISSLEDSLTILTRRRFIFFNQQNKYFRLFSRTPDNEPSISSNAINNTSNRSLSQSLNNSMSGRSNVTIGLSSQTSLYNSQNNKTSTYYFHTNVVENLVLFSLYFSNTTFSLPNESTKKISK